MPQTHFAFVACYCMYSSMSVLTSVKYEAIEWQHDQIQFFAVYNILFHLKSPWEPTHVNWSHAHQFLIDWVEITISK